MQAERPDVLISNLSTWWGTLLWAFNAASGVLAFIIAVRLYRWRNTLLIKQRHPLIVIVQIVFAMLTWIPREVLTPVVFVVATQETADFSLCFSDEIFTHCCGTINIFIHVVRVWDLYWRFFLGQYLAESRASIRRKYERRISNESEHSSTELRTKSRVGETRAEARRRRWRFRMVKFAILSLYTFVLVSKTVYMVVAWSLYRCDATEAMVRHVRTMAVPVLVLSILGPIGMLVALGKFRDNFYIFVELRNVMASYLVSMPVFTAVTIYCFVVDSAYWYPYTLIPYLAQAFVVVSGLIPLLQQRALDRKVRACDFAYLEKFEDVLRDPAALEALKVFMRGEFCVELLEFHESVSSYKHAYDLGDERDQKRAARVIFAQFVAPGSPAQINISMRLLRRICETMFGTTDVKSCHYKACELRSAPLTVFDEAQTEMAKLMRDGPFMRFMMLRRDTGSHKV